MSRRTKSKFRKSRPAPSVDPEQVLAGRVEARPEDLFDLIHRVNPTGEDLPGREQARRYALKQRLQSLLIRRFGEEHLTVAATGREGVVSLDHRSGTRDACHAVIDELEPDARAWVRRRLDLAAIGDEGVTATGTPAGEEDRSVEDRGDEVDELLRRGRRAIEEFDYSGAEELLERAFAGAPPGSERALAAAQALLELQVDTLGMDPAALDLEPRLDPRVREHPAVRTLLALAAARLGDAERALELVAGLTPATAGLSLPRTAEVYAALTAAAVRDHHRDGAERFLARLAELDAIHPQIPHLTDEIAGLRAEDFHADEAELERRFRDRGAAAVEAEARALADRWPEGKVARRILRRAAAERRRAEIAEHLERAAAAGAEARFADAERHYRAALDAGSQRPDLPALAAEARQAARQQRRRAAAAAVVDGFAATPGSAAGDEDLRRQRLLAYLALAEDCRARVREQIGEPVLGWLDELNPPRSGTRAQAAVTAVLALERAGSALAAGDPRTAVDELEAQRTSLRHIERARSLWREARQRLVEERRRRGREALEAVRSALDRGRIREAKRLLDAVPRADLGHRDRSRAEDLELAIGDAEVRERLERSYEDRLAAGDLAAALTRARVLARRSRGRGRCSSPSRPPKGRGATEHRQWGRRVADLQGRLRSAWELEVVTAEAPVAEATPPSHWRERTLAWLDGEGRELVLATAWDRWLFVSLVDVRRSRVTARVSLKTPRSLEQPLLTRRHGDRLWIAGRDGDVVELDRNGWQVLGFYPLGELVTGERSLDGVVPLAESPWVWMRVKGEWGGDVTWVADRFEHRVVRRLTDGLTDFVPILGGEPRVLRSGPRLAARLYTGAGEPASSEPLVRGYVHAADLGPDGRSLLLLAYRDAVDGETPGGGEGKDRVLELLRFAATPAGGDLERLELSTAHTYGYHALATSPERGLSFVLVDTAERGNEILVFAASPPAGPLAPLVRSRWRGRTTLVHDGEKRHVAAASFAAGGVELRFLDAAEPALAGLGEGSKWKGGKFPATEALASCGQPTGGAETAVAALAAELEERDADELQVFLAHTETRASAAADDQVVAALAVQRQRDFFYRLRQPLEDYARRLADRFPRHPGARLLAADFAARDQRWQEVGPLLGRASPKGLDAGRACHFHHLAGLAHLHAGRLPEAHRAFRRGRSHRGTCELEPLEQLTQPFAEPPRDEEWAPDQPLVRRLVGALRTADAAVAAGDPEAARAALDRRDLRWQVETQIAARRARVYLETAAASAEERFRERGALAFFLHVRQLERWLRRDLFLPGLHWEEERLVELEARVRARLGSPRTPPAVRRRPRMPEIPR